MQIRRQVKGHASCVDADACKGKGDGGFRERSVACIRGRQTGVTGMGARLVV